MLLAMFCIDVAEPAVNVGYLDAAVQAVGQGVLQLSHTQRLKLLPTQQGQLGDLLIVFWHLI